MSLEDELNAVSKVVSGGGNYISEPCVDVVKLKKYEMSPKDHKGCPYIEFTFETLGEDKKSLSNRFYRVREGDSELVIEIKNKKLKELLANALADFSLKGEEVIKSAIDNNIKVLFKRSEYPAVDPNENNKPIIKTKIEYSFSKKEDQELTGTQNYFNTSLNAKSRSKFDADLAKWERDNPTNSEPTQTIQEPSTTDVDDGLPF